MFCCKCLETQLIFLIVILNPAALLNSCVNSNSFLTSALEIFDFIFLPSPSEQDFQDCGGHLTLSFRKEVLSHHLNHSEIFIYSLLHGGNFPLLVCRTFKTRTCMELHQMTSGFARLHVNVAHPTDEVKWRSISHLRDGLHLLSLCDGEFYFPVFGLRIFGFVLTIFLIYNLNLMSHKPRCPMIRKPDLNKLPLPRNICTVYPSLTMTFWLASIYIVNSLKEKQLKIFPRFMTLHQ